MVHPGSARQPGECGKQALDIEEEEQLVGTVKKTEEPHLSNKNVTVSYPVVPTTLKRGNAFTFTFTLIYFKQAKPT
jgi:hypothetical protein